MMRPDFIEVCARDALAGLLASGQWATVPIKRGEDRAASIARLAFDLGEAMADERDRRQQLAKGKS